MSGNSTKSNRRKIVIVLTGLLLLSLLIFFAWPAPKRATPPQVAKSQSPAPQNNQPSAREQAGGRLAASQIRAQRILKYGRAEGELGIVSHEGQPPVGPESFALAKDGGILVADVVNQRIALYSNSGTYLRSIELPGIALGDVMVDTQGRVYAYDQVRHSLHQYDAQGAAQSTLDLSPADIDTRGYFHIAGNSVYFADAAARDVLVATLQDGVLTAADKSSERTPDGIHGDSGRTYAMSLDKGQAVRLHVRDEAAKSAAHDVVVPVPGIVSARFAGEDQARRYYIQTERLAGTNIALEVLTFSPTGELAGTTRMPKNDYVFWTTKLVDVQTDGTIVQFLPQQDQAELNLFAN